MIRNYIKVALRNLLSHKLHSFITIAGLAFGLVCFLMMFSYLQFEMSYDDFHVNADRIFRLDKIVSFKGNTFPRSLTGASTAPLLHEAFPSIVNVVRFGNLFSSMVTVGDNVYIEKRFMFADSAVLPMFSFPLQRGNPKTALANPLSVVITPQTAERYFGNLDPVGQTIYFQSKWNPGKFAFTVTGVTGQIPSNSTIKFDFLASFSSLPQVMGVPSLNDSWDGPIWTYVMLDRNTDPEALVSQFPLFAEKYIPKGDFHATGFRLVPLKSTYYDKGDGAPMGDWGLRPISYVLLVVSLLVLLIACINYMSLVAARSVTRAKEIGVRKVQGANRIQLIIQFIGESVILSLISLLFALALFELLLPSFKAFLSAAYPSFGILPQREVDFNVFYPELISFMVLVSIVVGIVAGVYPAIVLSRYNPVDVLKGEIRGGKSSAWFRKALVIAQFTVSIMFTVCSLHLLLQIQHWKSADLSFDKNDVVAIPVYDTSVKSRYDLLKSRLLQSADIAGVTSSSLLPGGEESNFLWLRSGGVKDLEVITYFVDEDFIRTMKLTVEQGRDVSKAIAGETRTAIFMNQAAMKACGWTEVQGQEIELCSKENEKSTVQFAGRLIGEVGNFRYRFLTPDTDPLILKIEPQLMNYVLIRVNRGSNARALEYIRTAWKDLRFDQAFEYSYLSDELDRPYVSFEAFDSLVRFAAIGTIFIAGLGLFALASFVIDRKTKEIGIRKTMGASTNDIVYRLTKSFVALVLVANAIALPLSYFGISRMLQEVPYHIEVSIWLFAAGSLFLVLLSILVIGSKSLKAANANPVESLRYE